MGTAVSRNLELATNEYCLKFVGINAISSDDPFWNTFLAFSIAPPTTRADQLLLESKIEPLLQQFLKNNKNSRNFNTLIELFVFRSRKILGALETNSLNVGSDACMTIQLFNIIFTIRCVLKYLAETTKEEQLVEHIEASNETLESFVNALIKYIVEVPIEDDTYAIHLECVTCLLILLSVQYHSNQKANISSIFSIIMKGRHVISAPLFVKRLLNNFISQSSAPSNYGTGQGQSIVLGLANDLWSMLTFTRKSNDDNALEINDYQHAPLATQSILLLLVLVHNWTTLKNPYRLSLFSCLNQDNNPTPPTKENTNFKIDFNSLFGTLCKTVSKDAPTLLLYLLLHQNRAFKTYLLSRMDLHELLVPILKTLYNAPNSHSHHIYMSLIILLILSEDDVFNKTVHEIKLKNINWYSERQLMQISLGGLLVLIIIRTIHYNMLKMRDKYLHTNCLAALANMSSQFRELHPYVSQRLISLFETLARKYQKLSQRPQNNKINLDDSTTTSITICQDGGDLEQDLNVLEGILRMVLEIINSVLTAQLINNPNLIYTLLYNKHIFEPFRDNVVFQDIIHNIDIVVKFFSQLLVENSQHNEVDAQQVLQVIQQGGKYWPKDKLTKFPDLKFKYVEEDQTEEFFIPYIWDLINQQSVLNWRQNSLVAVC